LTALVHALAAATFYPYETLTCLEISPRSAHLSGHAPGIDESSAMRAVAERREAWRAHLPEEVTDLWSFVSALDPGERLKLLAHCASLTVNAVHVPKSSSASNAAHADTIAQAVALDMTAYWQAGAASYFARVSKDRILEAVREGASEQAAQNIVSLKKQQMAEAAEGLLAGKGWLPALLRTEAP
jgi:ParB family chromosome partitioning protein